MSSKRNELRYLLRFASRLPFGLVVVVILPVSAILALLQPNLRRTAGGFLPLLRVVEVGQNWRGSAHYGRWAPDMAFGYGHPIFNYFAPFAPSHDRDNAPGGPGS